MVLTSSFAAIGYTPKPGAEFTEDDWTDPDMPGLPPYPRSKTIAERAAWDFMRSEGGGTELIVVNPTFILGPPLTAAAGSSMYLIKAMFGGQMSVAPRHRFGIADVRDVADLHIRAMAAPGAAGKRFIGVSDHPPMSYLELAEILRRAVRPAGRQGAHRGGTGGRPAAAGDPQRPGQGRARLAPAPGGDDDRGHGREPARARRAARVMTVPESAAYVRNNQNSHPERKRLTRSPRPVSAVGPAL